MKDLLKDIMVDIETLGSGGYTALVQLSAVQFSRYTGVTKKKFATNIDLQSCLDVGLKINGETIYWWLSRSEEARQSILKGPKKHIGHALQLFCDFLQECCEGEEFTIMDLSLWGRSPRFDIAIIYDAFTACGLKLVWDLRKEMCVRTIESQGPEIKKEIDEKNKGRVMHDGLVDCLHQIEYVSEIYKRKNLQ
jgi:hypothetical protein